MSKITSSQTIGPFPHPAWQWAVDLCTPARLESSAPAITISGAMFDGDGVPVNDAQVEAWMPEAGACEASQAIPGFRRVPTGDNGEFSLRLSLPPRPPGEPVAYVALFARGLTVHQFTAIFLEDDPDLPRSALLEQVPSARRPTLIAKKTGAGEYRWDIWLQSDKETVFFDYL
jgi:protocatechuate 3,4-dioxygenase alpha subunit